MFQSLHTKRNILSNILVWLYSERAIKHQRQWDHITNNLNNFALELYFYNLLNGDELHDPSFDLPNQTNWIIEC